MTDDPGSGAPAGDQAYKRAHDRAEMVQGLYIHLLVYVVINAGLFAINWATTGGDGPWWFYWTLLGWGIGVAVHVVATLVPVFSPEWVDRRAERIASRHSPTGR